MKFIKKAPEDEKWLEMITEETEIIRNFPSIFEESNPEILAKSASSYVLASSSRTYSATD